MIDSKYDPLEKMKKVEEEEGDERPVEEDALIELGQVSVLSDSTYSLRKHTIQLDKKTSAYVTSKQDLNELDELDELKRVPDATNGSCLENFKNKHLELIRHSRGFLFVLLYAVLFSISGILVKRAYLLSGSDITLIRYFVQLVSMFTIARLKNLNILGPPKQRVLLSVRGLIGQFSIVALNFSLTLIAPADTIAISNSSLIVASVLAWLFLKEKLTLAHVFAIFLTIIGVTFISKPTFIFGNRHSLVQNSSFINCGSLNETLGDGDFQLDTVLKSLQAKKSDVTLTANQTQSRCLDALIDQFTRLNESNVGESVWILEQGPEMKRSSHLFYLGIFFALVYSFGSGSVQVMIKKLCIQKVHFTTSTIYASYFGIPSSIVISSVLFLTGTSHAHFDKELHLHLLPFQIFIALVSAFFGVFAQVFLNVALNYEDASKITILKSLDLFFTFLLQFFLLGIEPDLMSVIGAVLIITGSICIVTYKLIGEKRKNMRRQKSTRFNAHKVAEATKLNN